jgi:hypothetical protein
MNLSSAASILEPCAKVVKLAVAKIAKSKNLIIVVFLSLKNKRVSNYKGKKNRNKLKYYATFIKKVQLTNNFEKTTNSVDLKK